jgi:hypothetical protein
MLFIGPNMPQMEQANNSAGHDSSRVVYDRGWLHSGAIRGAP